MKMNTNNTFVPSYVNKTQRLLKGSLALLLCASLSACAGITPWVKPYERQNLADPVMSWSRDGLADGYMHHVYQARESARGAEGGSGGGCGCN